MSTENKNKSITEEPEQPTKPTIVEETSSVTQHKIEINGAQLEYTVTTGTIVLKEEDVELGEKQKLVFFT